ncbi:hypothetical protein BD410DRAFT_806642 [Rickenella mellea]|uniref:Uncharacterized protein n=1 Tax=Rickenella mellea TaxID=50990 RepID=A0A4Y7PTB3_9AGAM|nr:hypothetical protein BD410DRAFT_806642 [Rickenella mellea]
MAAKFATRAKGTRTGVLAGQIAQSGKWRRDIKPNLAMDSVRVAAEEAVPETAGRETLSWSEARGTAMSNDVVGLECYWDELQRVDRLNIGDEADFVTAGILAPARELEHWGRSGREVVEERRASMGTFTTNANPKLNAGTKILAGSGGIFNSTSTNMGRRHHHDFPKGSHQMEVYASPNAYGYEYESDSGILSPLMTSDEFFIDLGVPAGSVGAFTGIHRSLLGREQSDQTLPTSTCVECHHWDLLLEHATQSPNTPPPVLDQRTQHHNENSTGTMVSDGGALKPSPRCSGVQPRRQAWWKARDSEDGAADSGEGGCEAMRRGK